MVSGDRSHRGRRRRDASGNDKLGNGIRTVADRRLNGVDGSLEQARRNILARLHGGHANEVAAAGQHSFAAIGHYVFTFADQQGAFSPLDLIAAAERGEDHDVRVERMHRGVAVAAIAIERMENGIFVDALEEFIDGRETAAEEREIQGPEGDRGHRSGLGGGLRRRRGIAVAGTRLQSGRCGGRRLGSGGDSVTGPDKGVAPNVAVVDGS